MPCLMGEACRYPQSNQNNTTASNPGEILLGYQVPSVSIRIRIRGETFMHRLFQLTQYIQYSVHVSRDVSLHVCHFHRRR